MGGLAFPYLIGQMIDISSTSTFPWMMLGLAVIALVAFARANTVLGGLRSVLVVRAVLDNASSNDGQHFGGN